MVPERDTGNLAINSFWLPELTSDHHRTEEECVKESLQKEKGRRREESKEPYLLSMAHAKAIFFRATGESCNHGSL